MNLFMVIMTKIHKIHKDKNKAIWRQNKYKFSRQKKYQKKMNHISAHH